MYDLGGEEAVNSGYSAADAEAAAGGGGFPQGFKFGSPGGASFHFSRGNAEDIFRQFFGTNSPFGAGDDDDGFSGFPGGVSFGGMPGMMGGMGGMHGMSGMHGMGGMPRARQPQQLPKAHPVHYPLGVTLEELYLGAVRKVRITKKIRDAASGQITSVSVDKEITVQQGTAYPYTRDIIVLISFSRLERWN